MVEGLRTDILVSPGMQRCLGGAAVSVVASNYLDKAIGPRFKSVSGLLFLPPTAISPKLHFFPGRAHSSLFGTRCMYSGKVRSRAL